MYRDHRRLAIEGAHIHKFGFTHHKKQSISKEINEAESKYMNIGPLNYQSSTVPDVINTYM